MARRFNDSMTRWPYVRLLPTARCFLPTAFCPLPTFLRWRDSLQAVEVGPQGGGYYDGAVGLLVILDDRHPRAADGQAAAVQGVQQLRLAGLAAPEAQIGAACLESLKIRAGGYFLILARGGQPDFDVVGLGGAEAHVARAKRDDAVRQLQPLEDFFRIVRQAFEFVVGVFRERELDQLHLLELVLADDAARVLAVGARLAAEAGGPGAMLHGKLLRLQHLVAIEIGHGDFRRGDQPIIRAFELEEILFELGQLAGAEKAGGVHHERRQNFRVTVLAGMHIEHEVGERPLQLRADSGVHGKARAGDLGGALEIQNPQRRAQIPMRLGREIELARLAPAADFLIVGGASAHRDARVRNVGNQAQHLAQALVAGLRLLIQFLNLGPEGLHIRNQRGGILLLLFERGNFIGGFVAPRLAPFHFHQHPAALAIERFKIAQDFGEPALAHFLL